MRVALLSTLESAADAGIPRGLLRVGGHALIEHQLGLAITCGSERVLCLADGMPGDLMGLQHLAEEAGQAFRFVSSGHDLARLVGPEDELLVFTGGLLAPGQDVARLVQIGPGIVVQPAETGLPAGFERIDLNHADAGVLRVPGMLVTRLADLPSDWNPSSALLRLAAQAGLPQRELQHQLAQDKCWTLVRSEAEAQAVENCWLRLHAARAGQPNPGSWLSVKLVQRLGPALLHAGTSPALLVLGAAFLALAGAGFGWAGWPGVGFTLLGGAWLVNESARLLSRASRELTPLRQGRAVLRLPFDWLLDGALVLSCAIRAQQPAGGELAWMAAWFVPLVLFGQLRVLPRLFAARRWAPWLEDRLILAGLLLALALTKVFAPALMALTLVMIIVTLVLLPPAKAEDGSDDALADG